MTFGGYDRKLDHGVAIIYLLQPEWWDHIYHKDRVKNRKAQPVSTEWKSQDHITREIDEAIAAFYDRDIFTPNTEIARLVEVGDKRVQKWIKDNRPEKRKRIKRKGKDAKKIIQTEEFKKIKCHKRHRQQAPAVHKVDSDETQS